MYFHTNNLLNKKNINLPLIDGFLFVLPIDSDSIWTQITKNTK